MIPKKTIEELINKHAYLEKDLSSEKIEKKEFFRKVQRILEFEHNY